MNSPLNTQPLLVRFLFCVLSLLCPILPANAQKPEPAPVKAGSVSSVYYVNDKTKGVFRQIGKEQWVDGKVEYRETARDEWSVFLESNEGTKVQLDLLQKTITFSGSKTGQVKIMLARAGEVARPDQKSGPTKEPGKPAAPNLPPKPSAPTVADLGVKGMDVLGVEFDRSGTPGYFRQTSHTAWTEDGRYQWSEVKRDEWNVYLSNNNGGTAQLDLSHKTVTFGGVFSGTYPIPRASKPADLGVNGMEVTGVEFDRGGTPGNFLQVSQTRWSEDGKHDWLQTGRDQWSVYLSNNNGGTAQLDLFLKTVTFGGVYSGTYFIPKASKNPVAARALTPQDAVVKQNLGRGYNAIGVFCMETYRGESIFDLNDPANYILDIRSGTTEIDIKSGSSADEFSRNLSVNVQGEIQSGLFAASVKVGVEKSSSGSNKTSFAQVDDKTVLFTARLNGARPTAEALRNLNELPVDQVIQRYGTHFINFAEFGGHLTFNTYLQERERRDGLNINSEAEASYKIASGKVEVNSSTSTFAKSMSERGQFFCTGGNNTLNHRTQFNDQLYTDWKLSLPHNPALAGFGPATVKDSLIGIWYVPGLRPGRPQELYDAVYAYVEKSKIGIFDKPGAPVITKNSNFKLKGADGRWFSQGVTSSNYWYATLGGSGQTHNFDGNGEPLLSGHVVRLRTLNPAGGYPAYNKLMAPKSGNTCYYSYNNGDYENWRVWLDGKDLRPGEPIYFGDKVVIENVSWSDCYLAPASDKWVGVPRGNQYRWEVLP